MVHIRQSICLVLANVLSVSLLMLHATYDEISTTLPISSGKGRYTRCMWNNDKFILWNHISAIFYEVRECCFTHLAKTFKRTYQVDSLLKNECKTCSPGTQFCK